MYLKMKERELRLTILMTMEVMDHYGLKVAKNTHIFSLQTAKKSDQMSTESSAAAKAVANVCS